MRTTNEPSHRPCLLAETLSFLAAKNGGVYCDATCGHGHFSAALLGACGPTGRLLALDIDPAAVRAASDRLAAFGGRCRVVQGSYEHLADLAREAGFREFDGIVIDAGALSTEQLLDPSRGFSFTRPGPLSMKLDPAHPGPDAAELVRTLSPVELARLFVTAGESRATARRVADEIVSRRARTPIAETTDLAHVVEDAVRKAGKVRGESHPATRVFLGLRLATTGELAALEEGTRQAVACLREEARLALLTYHGLEHRLARTLLRDMERGCVCPPSLPVCGCGRAPLVRRLAAKPLSPSPREIAFNPSARSARLHCVARTSTPM
jgi:16S rRNA (cytosine1402-N4)-methyltransferase